MLLDELKKIRKHLEKLHTGLNDQVSAINSAEESREKNRDIKPFWIDQILSEYQEPVSDKKKESERTYRVQKSLKRATWLAFFAAAIYAAIAAWQLSQTKEAVHQATRGAKAAEQANIDAGTRFVIDERPYMWVTDPTGVIGKDTDGFLSWNVYYKNFGKSPAIHVRVRMFLATGQDAMNKVKYIPETPMSAGSDIRPPNGPASFATGEFRQVLSDADIQRLYDTQNGIVVYGRVDYSGTDGTRYWSLFCMGRQKNTGIVWCKSHNEIH
ncbi:MAG TPA: hypothetical protein VHV29_11965 [Terriglobales bacterium]|nr:hypothetical protein [Terriglobales bacterium]